MRAGGESWIPKKDSYNWFGLGREISVDPLLGDSMGISLGPLGDLLWKNVPELRQQIFELVKENFEEAIAAGAVVGQLTGFELAGLLLHRRLIVPAMERWPNSGEELSRLLSFVTFAMRYEGPEKSSIRGDLVANVIHKIVHTSDEKVVRAAFPGIGPILDRYS